MSMKSGTFGGVNVVGGAFGEGHMVLSLARSIVCPFSSIKYEDRKLLFQKFSSGRVAKMFARVSNNVLSGKKS